MNVGWLIPMALLVSASAARADESFRCGKWIASSDMSVTDLLAKCGEPHQRVTTTEDVKVRNRNTGLMQKLGEVIVERWTYDRGNNAPPMVVTIVDGRIKSLDRQK
jgi:Protein of unknown function (DUF2845)